jgi:hypothetical protein
MLMVRRFAEDGEDLAGGGAENLGEPVGEHSGVDRPGDVGPEGGGGDHGQAGDGGDDIAAEGPAGFGHQHDPSGVSGRAGVERLAESEVARAEDQQAGAVVAGSVVDHEIVRLSTVGPEDETRRHRPVPSPAEDGGELAPVVPVEADVPPLPRCLEGNGAGGHAGSLPPLGLKEIDLLHLPRPFVGLAVASRAATPRCRCHGCAGAADRSGVKVERPERSEDERP